MKKIYFTVAFGLLVSQLLFSSALASSLQNFKITLADSRAATAAVETATVQLSAGNTFAANQTVVITWPAGFVFPADGTWTTGDFSFNDGTARTVVAVGAAPVCTAGSNNVDVTTNQTNRTLTVTACSSYNASSPGAIIAFGIGNTNKITNPSVASYTITVKETTDDQSAAVVVITNGVSVSVTVTEALNFTVTGDTAISCPTTGGTKVDTSNDPTSVPFGLVIPGAFYDACQQLTISSNATGVTRQPFRRLSYRPPAATRLPKALATALAPIRPLPLGRPAPTPVTATAWKTPPAPPPPPPTPPGQRIIVAPAFSISKPSPMLALPKPPKPSPRQPRPTPPAMSFTSAIVLMLGLANQLELTRPPLLI